MVRAFPGRKGEYCLDCRTAVVAGGDRNKAISQLAFWPHGERPSDL